MPTSCWPRPRICCRSIPARPTKVCWRGFRRRSGAKASQPARSAYPRACRIRRRPSPYEARRRYHGGRRQFCGGLFAARLAGTDPIEPRAPGIISPALSSVTPARSSRARRCRQIYFPTGHLSQGIRMTRSRQEKLEICSNRPRSSGAHHRAAGGRRAARRAGRGRRTHAGSDAAYPVALEAAKAIIADVPDAVVGIGTILNADDLARAEALGAKFGISPGATPELLKAAAASAPAVRAGDRDGVGTDAGAGARL